MKKTVVNQLSGLLFAALASTANAGGISILQDTVELNLDMSIDIPAEYNEGYGIEDWTFSDSYEGAGIGGVRLYGEKYYGKLPGQDESTWMTGFAEISDYSSDEYTSWNLRMRFDPNNEPNPGNTFGEGSIVWRLVFDVTGEEVMVNVGSWADFSGSSVFVSLSDLGSGASYAFTLDDYESIELLGGHRYSLQIYSHLVYESNTGDGALQVDLQFNAGSEVYSAVPSAPATLSFP